MTRWPASIFLPLVAVVLACASVPAAAETWGEKLGYPAGKKVLILHADDIGMCYEANQAAKELLPAGVIQSAAMMVPCPWFPEIAAWYLEHPDFDMGLHLALTSEWKYYRWGPVAPASEVPGLLDKKAQQRYLWPDVLPVAMNASPAEIEREIRAQLARALELGIKPSHIDTHMGTLYARPDYTAVYMKVAEEFRIPAMVIENTPEVMAKFKRQGYPITDQLRKLIDAYKLPKLDDFDAVDEGKTYDEKLSNFFAEVRSLRPGITELIFHPSAPSEGLKHITGSWQQRIWEYQMFSDPRVQEFLKTEGIVFTNWKEIMQRFDERAGATAK
ncbi:MAG: polysaccharide deacetylase family protein [Pirellulales bacterium]|nr:polysaccharide deacetylase family protein [Pirellulales bacterium]